MITEINRRYVNYISEALYNFGLDSDEEVWKQDPLLLRSFVQNRDPIVVENSETLGITQGEEFMLLIRLNEDGFSRDKIVEIAAKELSKIKEKKLLRIINIVWFFRNVKSRIEIASILSNPVQFKKELSAHKISGIRRIRSILYLDGEAKTKTKEYKLKAKRYEMLIHKDNRSHINDNDALRGYVFTANLFDIVELYNEIGDDIFKKNLRLGIKEQMGVDSAIKETLRTAPDHFWFRNGGITILIKKTDLVFDRTNEIVLKRAGESERNFWIINGAQTISAAADFYYGEKGAEDSKRAKVIVRIIQINEKSTKAESDADIISIALNRQKPIKDEDIAFNNVVVREWNEYFNKEGYTLCRRSEFVHSPNAMSLVEFARARKAVAGHPGEARSSASSELLKTKDAFFQDIDIFVKELQKTEHDFS
ncbi:MAG: AIPR family protein, partial [Clostridia bacterium]|nr:AIPR family protein [Clostridia bacterium]